MPHLNRPAKWGIGIVVTLAVLAVAGPYVYIHYIQDEPAAPLTASAKCTPSTASTPTDASEGSTSSPSSSSVEATAVSGDSVDGTWAPTSGSQAGYRVKEILFGQSTTAVGRTNKVTGTVTITGTRLTSATFAVDMASVTSDESRRDGQFNNRIMNTAQFPTSTFVLSPPLDFGKVPTDASAITATATGTLTLRGTTKDVTVDLSAQRAGGAIEVTGCFEIVFADWAIPNPSFGPAQTGDTGTLEFHLVLAKQS